MKNTVIVWMVHRRTLKAHAFRGGSVSVCLHMSSKDKHLVYDGSDDKCKMCLRHIAREEKRHGTRQEKKRKPDG